MQNNRSHPLIPEAQDLLRQGKLTRSDFLRLCTLLGLSLVGAQHLAGCTPAAEPSSPRRTDMAAGSPSPQPSATPAIRRGGQLTALARVDQVDHPTRFSLVSQAHPWRHIFDYLTHTNNHGITHPYLLDHWQASDDLRTWTLFLRQGIHFSNGQELTTDDLLFNFSQWLDSRLESALVGVMNYLDLNGLEKLDDYTLVCHLNKPTIVLPEHLYHYAALVVPHTFEGDLVRQPVGTGAFTLTEFLVEERCRLRRRPGYWRKDAYGADLPYLDEIVLWQIDDPIARLGTLRSGQADVIVEPPVTVWEALKDDPHLDVTSTSTAATRVLRMRVDQPPWNDNRVRQALKYCHDRSRILAEALHGQGDIGTASHVAPAQPEYFELDPYLFDPPHSKALLVEAGYPDGLQVELVVAKEWPESLAYAQILQEDARAGGFAIQLKTVTASEYWQQWTEWNLGITWWAHRPLAPMMLAAAYTRDSAGEPVPWNETRWSDDEFEILLHKAESTLDVTARREIMSIIEQIMKERGPVCVPFFMNVWQICTTAVHGIELSPEEYAIFHAAWKQG